ncbi:MAG: GntR family transcriptional regulator, partial [Oscillospiraceae bacterium]|nr:GntR family transcriptional regulator [Oscillospiraceae bacterium]
VIGIAGKALRPGEALPSVRRMAADIGVHAHTVNKAYAMLRDEGYIVIDRRSGCRVSPAIPGADAPFAEGLREKLRPIAASAIGHGMRPEEFGALCEAVFKSLEGAT